MTPLFRLLLLLAMTWAVAGCATLDRQASLQEKLRHTAKVGVFDVFADASQNPQSPEVYCRPTWLPMDKQRVQALADGLSEAKEGEKDLDEPQRFKIFLDRPLTNLLFVDDRGSPLAHALISMWDSGVILFPCRRTDDGRYVVFSSEDLKKSLNLRCEPFVRDMYAYMQVHMKDRLEQVRKEFSLLGYDAADMEAILFRGKPLLEPLPFQTKEAMPEYEKKVYERLTHDTIPHLKLEDANFFEAMGVVKDFWEKNHPDMPFLCGVGHFCPTDVYRTADGKLEPSNTPRVMLDVKNIPYLVAVRYIADICGYTLKTKSGTLKLFGFQGINEGWSESFNLVTPAVLKALGLNKTSPKQDVMIALKSFGIEFSREFYEASLWEGSDVIHMRNLDEQQDRLRVILFLLKKGYKITK